MDTLVEMVERIRQMPAMVSPPSAAHLAAFLAGFAYARKDLCPDDAKTLKRFRDFVRERHGIKSPHDWPDVIAAFSSTEAEQTKLFWRHWEEFSTQVPVKEAPPTNGS